MPARLELIRLPGPRGGEPLRRHPEVQRPGLRRTRVRARVARTPRHRPTSPRRDLNEDHDLEMEYLCQGRCGYAVWWSGVRVVSVVRRWPQGDHPAVESQSRLRSSVGLDNMLRWWWTDSAVGGDADWARCDRPPARSVSGSVALGELTGLPGPVGWGCGRSGGTRSPADTEQGVLVRRAPECRSDDRRGCQVRHCAATGPDALDDEGVGGHGGGQLRAGGVAPTVVS